MTNRVRSTILLAGMLIGGPVAVVCLDAQSKKMEKSIEQTTKDPNYNNWDSWFTLHEDASHERIMQLQKWAQDLPAPAGDCSGAEQLSLRVQLQKNIEDLILAARKTNSPGLVQLQDNMSWVIALLAFAAGLLVKRKQ